MKWLSFPLLPKIPQQATDDFIINHIWREVFSCNKDNISRTKCYQRFFFLHPEIQWAFLASMVSRNGGWNMCDLYGPDLSSLIEGKIRKRLLLTYERANWLIFRDSYPQLLIYHYSVKLNRPLFHLLDHFNVSKFMKQEWVYFWKSNHKQRLMYALIVNEQYIIQRPVIEHPVYKKRIFKSSYFFFQELLHFSCVVFPTLGGELYGSSVTRFRNLWKRVELGKKLGAILFHEDLHPYFLEFASKTEHTGSRNDYEQYLDTKTQRSTPFLRTVVPVIEHHMPKYEHLINRYSLKSDWFVAPQRTDQIVLTNWFLKKQKQIHLFATLKSLFTGE